MRTIPQRPWHLYPVLGALTLVLVIHGSKSPRTAADGEPSRRNAPAMHLTSPEVNESSGLAKSNRQPGLFWTHNDSGDSARLFAFDDQGRASGGCKLAGVDAIDMEDMASFVQDGVPRLVFADVGDNQSRRQRIHLYFFDEPDPRDESVIRDYQRLDVVYPDGARDCEAIAVDATAGLVTLVSKSFLPLATVHQLDLPPRKSGRELNVNDQPLTLRPVGRLAVPLVTGMDRDERSGEIVVINYLQLFRFPAAADGRWWLGTPRTTDLPRWRQIEAVATDHQGRAWITSEGSPAPWGSVDESPTVDANAPAR
jgi:hypothetical protein